MIQQRRYKVAVLGATGAVGRELLQLLDQRRFPTEEVFALASPESVGKRVEFGKRSLVVQAANPDSFNEVEIVLCAAPIAVARRLLPEAAKRGATCIDCSGAFADDPQVPLVTPEVNPEALMARARIFALPRTASTLLAMILAPLHAQAGLKRTVIATYHSASGSGRKGIDELSHQTIALLNQRPYDVKVHPARVAFNTVPQVGPWAKDGQSDEEATLAQELPRLLSAPTLGLSITAALVPVFVGHSFAVHAEFERKITATQARTLLESAHGVTVRDEPSTGAYPMPLDCAEKDEVFVGRIRTDSTVPHGLAMWISADNLRQGAALTAVQAAALLHTLWTSTRA